MQTRFIPILSVISVALISGACNKAQSPAAVPQVQVPPNSNSLPAAPIPANTPSETPTAVLAKPAGIRAIDIKPFVESHLGELNPDLADLQTDCGDGQKPLQSLAPVLYADLDGDGQEEAVVLGWSCLSGNGGADFRGVLKLNPGDQLSVLPIEPMPKSFKGRDTSAGLRGHGIVEVKDGRLHERYPLYTNGEANCCPEGGDRRFVYRWDGHRFALDDMIDAPRQKSGN